MRKGRPISCTVCKGPTPRRKRREAAMAKPDILIVDGHAFSWQRLCELRRQQMETWRAHEARQLALFAMHNDHRVKSERTASGRYGEPTLLGLMLLPGGRGKAARSVT
jgi:hypothetical protein